MASEIKTKELPPLPSKVMEMPKIISLPEIGEVSPEVKASLPEGPIKVMATRAGFYKNCRLYEGDIFIISDKSKFGSWMKKV